MRRPTRIALIVQAEFVPVTSTLLLEELVEPIAISTFNTLAPLLNHQAVTAAIKADIEIVIIRPGRVRSRHRYAVIGGEY